MKPQNRQNRILSILRAMQREVHVDELAEMMDVSTITIRRDLDQLAGDRSIIRTHGGCLFAGRAALENEYHKKVRIHFSLKQAIGKAAAELIENGDMLLLNDGSTTYHLASQLGGNLGVSVYTNSLALVTEVSRFEGLELYIIGGKYNTEQYSLRGSMMERTLESFVFDKVFIGAEAVDAEGRCFVNSPEEARLTSLMLRSGRKRYLLADHTKIGAEGRCVYGSLEDFETWFTTPGIDEQARRELTNLTNIVVSPLAE